MTTKILFVGQLVPGSRSHQRIKALRGLDFDVTTLSTVPDMSTYEDRPALVDRVRHRMAMPRDRVGFNNAILEHVSTERIDILWIDRVPELRSRTLEAVLSVSPKTRLVWYAEDDMMSRQHRSRWLDQSIPLFDLWVTTKSFNADPQELPRLGARKVLFVNNAYDPDVHCPQKISETERIQYGADISFVGTYEGERAESLRDLASKGFNVRVWGNGWPKFGASGAGLIVEGRPVYDDEYRKVVAASSINLCFLRRANRDLQTCRSIEIPAMEGFMLHERNNEICGLLREGVQAAYFGDNEELIRQSRHWLTHDTERRAIAKAACERVRSGQFSQQDQITQIVAALEGSNKH